MKKSRLSVSIVIPAYNEESQLYGCLMAVQHQNDPPDEVVVVNNNSDDATAAIAQAFPFVKLVDEPRQGLRFARNTGVAVTGSDIVGRIDADTRLTPDWVANVRRLFSENPQIEAATGPAYYHDMPARKLSFGADKFLRGVLFQTQSYPLLYGSNMAFRSSAWRQVLPTLCDEGEFFEDIDLSIHLKDLNMQMAYDKNLSVGVSARRLDDSPKAFYNFLKFYDKTYERHGQSSVAAKGAKWVFMVIYPFCKIIRQFYNGRRWLALDGLRRKLDSRPSPNT